jgi:hypothetical protein
MVIVTDLNKRLPDRYVASPRVHLGTAFEVDVAASERVPPEPTLALDTELPEFDEYEVRVFDNELQRLVAAIEIVSPSNKDRADHRRAFAAKCASLLQQGVSVSIVDLVTARRGNLYGDLLDLLAHADPALAPVPPSIYAVTCRWTLRGQGGRMESWAHPLALGQPLPTIPLWLEPDRAIPLNLESTYEETCRSLRIA